MHSLCLNLNPSPDLQTDSLAFSGFPQANSHILENGRVPSKSRSVMFSCWLGARGHNAHALGHMGATRRGTYAAAEAATAATGSEARPSQASPSAAAAGGDGASPMVTAGALMVNEGAPMVDDAGDEDEESSDEEGEVV